MPVGTCFIKSPIFEGYDVTLTSATPYLFLTTRKISPGAKFFAVRENPRAGSQPFTLADYHYYPTVYEHFGDSRELTGLYGTRISPDYIDLSALCYNLFDPRQQIRHSEWFWQKRTRA